MHSDSDLYRDVADVYTRLVESDSPAAAIILRTIQRKEGAHATFIAALILTVLKRQIQDDHFLPNLKEYAYLFQDYSESIWLLEEAIAQCLHDWGLPDVTVALDVGNAERHISGPTDLPHS
jgi:hypothetical protein